MPDPTKLEAQAALNVLVRYVNAPAVPPVDPPDPPPVIPPGAAPQWVQGKQYAAGFIVSYEGRTYRAKAANPGYVPTVSTYYWEPYTGSGAPETTPDPVPVPDPVKPPVPLPAGAIVVAPYFHAWSGDKLTDAQKKAGVQHAFLAFGIMSGNQLSGEFLGKLPDGRAFVAAGGRLTLSFGGAQGIYAEVALTNEDALMSLLEDAMVRAGTRRLDWDIEGETLKNTAATARRARVLKRLQDKYPDIHITFTLPGWFEGVDNNSLDLLRGLIAAGVQIDCVNIMAMSFGEGNMQTELTAPHTMAHAIQVCMDESIKQVAALYPGRTPAQVNAMMSVCPMIGKNDDGVILTFEDARQVTAWALAKGIPQITFWSFQRDRQQATGNPSLGGYSGVAQSDYQYLKIFSGKG
jgi:hypothetical protein